MSAAPLAATTPLNELSRKRAELAAWVSHVLETAGLSGFAIDPTTSAPSAERSVKLSLAGIAAAPPARELGVTPLQFRARYLLVPSAPSLEEREAALGELVFAALAGGDWEAELPPRDATSSALSQASGAPQLYVSTLVRRTPHTDEAKRARVAKLQLRTATAAHALHGRVLGPQDVPIAGALLEWPALARSTVCDARGAFRFALAPLSEAPIELRIQAKGKCWTVRVERPRDPAQALEVRLEL